MAITPPEVENLEDWAKRAIERGATALVIRLSRGISAGDLERWACNLPENLPWIVHASWAVQPYGWGMHFPAPPAPPGSKITPSYLYGQSCHNEEEVATASKWASYVWIGSFFP
ncbi:MAG: thiamine phosphate synthase, partial [Bacteroidia bacterium]|nr:thiamine phosphate synthase [Bacteroidia bacterium]